MCNTSHMISCLTCNFSIVALIRLGFTHIHGFAGCDTVWKPYLSVYKGPLSVVRGICHSSVDQTSAPASAPA